MALLTKSLYTWLKASAMKLLNVASSLSNCMAMRLFSLIVQRDVRWCAFCGTFWHHSNLLALRQILAEHRSLETGWRAQPLALGLTGPVAYPFSSTTFWMCTQGPSLHTLSKLLQSCLWEGKSLQLMTQSSEIVLYRALFCLYRRLADPFKAHESCQCSGTIEPSANTMSKHTFRRLCKW